MTARRMWCDDFDLDLPKAVPDARVVVGGVGNVILYTHATKLYDTLNHPSCWNHNTGYIAFFGFEDPCKPPDFHTQNPVVECTFWEVLRDGWTHSFTMIVERQAQVIDFGAPGIRHDFHLLAQVIRGTLAATERQILDARARVLNVLAEGAARMSAIAYQHQERAKRLEVLT